MLWRHWFWVKSDLAWAHVPSRTMTAALLPSLPTGIGGSVVMSTAKEKRCLEWLAHLPLPFPPLLSLSLPLSLILICFPPFPQLSSFVCFSLFMPSMPASGNTVSHLPSWPGNRTRLSGDKRASLSTLYLLQHHQKRKQQKVRLTYTHTTETSWQLTW